MNPPFTQQQFFDVFGRYNGELLPAIIVAYLLGVLAVALVPVRARISDRITSGVLALMWAWTGGVYHLGYFAEINPAARLFGAAFLLEGLGLFVYGAILGRMEFASRLDTRRVLGGLLVLFSMVIYPLLGPLTGHLWPRMPMFGVVPCPVTIFTFGLMMCTRHRVPWWLAAIPVLWALVGTSAAVLFGVYQDVMLLVSAVLFVVFNLRVPRAS